jgi:hypothetical protein
MQIFKVFLENQSKFRYTEKLFQLDMVNNVNSEDIKNFVRLLDQNLSIKKSFLSVKKLQKLLGSIDRGLRNSAAKQVRNLKRCLYNMED